MNRFVIFGALFGLGLVAGFFVTRANRAPVADLWIGGGPIHTLGPPGTVDALAVRDGRVVAAGSRDSLTVWIGEDTEVIELDGRAVIPGLTDSHFHSIGGGRGVDLSSARSVLEVVAAIGDRAATLDTDVVVVSNSDWHEGQLAEQRLPLRDDLDPVSRGHAVVLVRGGHQYILNSRALERFGIDENVVDPPGGRFGRYPDGRLNGELVDRAKEAVELPPSPEITFERRLDDLERQHLELNSFGLTSIRYAGGSLELWRALAALRDQGRLTVRASVLLRPPYSTSPADYLDALSEWGLSPGEGDEWLRVAGVKLGVDGGFEGGLMRDPYEEPWGDGGQYTGLQIVPRVDFTETVRTLHGAGWRVATHAVGDAAIDLVLDAYEAADADASIADRRWVIEHGFIARRDHFARMRELGLSVTAQNHLYLAAPALVRYWGRDRAGLTTPLRTYLDEGIPVSIGTDAPVVPYNPWWAIYHFATRGTISAGVLDASEAVPVAEVLKASSVGGAHLTFEEDSKGTLEVGMLADLTVLPIDPLTADPSELEAVRPEMTVLGGRVVWSAASN